MYDHVIWPERYDPKISAIYALNDIDVKAPPEVVWKLLVDAENWSRYFPAEDQVKILSGERELTLGTRYSRVTVGFPMSLVMTECVPDRRLAWAATRFIWVRSAAGKAKLAALASEKNRPKILQAPLTVIIGNDLDFADQSSTLMPHNAEAMQKAFAAPGMAGSTAMRKGSIQGA